MAHTPDWTEKAEAEYKREQEDLEADGKGAFFLHLFFLAVILAVMAALYVVKCLITGEDFLPRHREDAWWLLLVVGYIPFMSMMERFDGKRELREKRLIRLEMKIDSLMSQQDASMEQDVKFQRDVQRAISDIDLQARGLL